MLESVKLALYGAHRFRTEDAWISRGESSAEVELMLTGGYRVLRTRQRGKRTTFYLFTPQGTQAMQDDAQRAVHAIVGLGEEDFPHIAQRHAARLVNARPEERMQIVGAWLNLAPLERCEDEARARASALAARASLVLNQQRTLAEVLGDVVTKEPLERAVEGAKKVLDEARAELAVAQQRLVDNGERVAAQQARSELAEVIAEGQKLRADLDRRDPAQARKDAEAAEARRREAATAYDAAAREQRQKEALACGQFDGHCPVAERACPVAAEINQDRARNEDLRTKARRGFAVANKLLDEATSGASVRAARAQEDDRLGQRLVQLREQAKRLQDRARSTAEPPDDPNDLRNALDDAQRRVEDALGRVSRTAEALRLWTDAEARLGALKAEAGEVHADLARAQAAVRVFGRSGAQRKVAETAMAGIERGANAALAAAGSPLTIAVRWSQEGSGLARACDACGAPYPTSARVKACERCGAARGLNLMHRLDFDLSDRSGGLEDLAGVGLSLAAAAWLRRERGAAWSALLIDEPFAHLDKSRRRALGKHFASMLTGGFEFEQSFVVAHTSDVVDAMPARIEIVRHRDGWSECKLA